MTQKEMISGLMMLKKSYAGKVELTTANYEVYYMVLGELSVEVFKVAIQYMLKQGFDFFPSAGKIYQTAKGLIEKSYPTAEEAWSNVLRHIRSRELNSRTTLDDRTEYAARLVGGYDRIGDIDVDELKWIEKKFIEIYDEYDEIHESRKAIEGCSFRELQTGINKQLESEGKKPLFLTGKDRRKERG